MTIRRYNEEQCGKIAKDGLHQTKKDLNTLNQSGHLLSCGGAYISQSSLQGNPVKNSYSFLSLPKRTAPPVVLKNNQIQESEENLGEENSEQNEESSEKTFQYRRKKLNPDEVH